MFRDNKSEVTGSTIPTSILNRRHHISSYHCVREAIAAKSNRFYGEEGKAILSKYWVPFGHSSNHNFSGEEIPRRQTAKGEYKIPTNHPPSDQGRNSSLAGFKPCENYMNTKEWYGSAPRYPEGNN